MLNHYFMTLLVAAVPVIELRGAIPYGIAMGLTPWETFSAALIGNLLPIPFIMLLIRRIFDFLRKRSFWEGKIEHLEKKAHLKGRMVKKYRTLGLILLVAIPLPGTGAWTGALVASLLDIRMQAAIPAIFAGLLIAGGIILSHLLWHRESSLKSMKSIKETWDLVSGLVSTDKKNTLGGYCPG